MSDKELFMEVLDNFIDTYGLSIERPYGDSCLSIIKDNKELGMINPSGYNLLRNLTELCKILNSELR